MDIAMIGLGKMGGNMARRLLRAGHRVIAYDFNEKAIQAVEAEGAKGIQALEEIPKMLSPVRAVWLMVPTGPATGQTIKELAGLLEPGDIIIDGGNSHYQDSLRRAGMLQKKKLHLVDVGTSGGVWGLREGYSMMVGGKPEIVEYLRPIFETLAPRPDRGWGHVGPVGAGHFVKMIHNGIEYGVMEAYAEGFELMQHKHEFNLDLHQIAQIWCFGSVIRSWLLELAADILAENPALAEIAAYVPDSGEGRWTVAEAIELNCAIPVITLALQRRFRSREESPFGDRLLAALRHEFGGHNLPKR